MGDTEDVAGGDRGAASKYQAADVYAALAYHVEYL